LGALSPPPNFVATAVRAVTQGTAMRVVDDQVGTPTRAAHLARLVDGVVAAIIANSAFSGSVHATDAGVASRYDLACAVLDRLAKHGVAPATDGVMPVPTAEFPRLARRTLVALLDCHATWTRLGLTPPHWRVCVRGMVHGQIAAAG
jgi:dTDP-4-dehydrorhamnose reductase